METAADRLLNIALRCPVLDVSGAAAVSEPSLDSVMQWVRYEQSLIDRIEEYHAVATFEEPDENEDEEDEEEAAEDAAVVLRERVRELQRRVLDATLTRAHERTVTARVRRAALALDEEEAADDEVDDAARRLRADARAAKQLRLAALAHDIAAAHDEATAVRARTAELISANRATWARIAAADGLLKSASEADDDDDEDDELLRAITALRATRKRYRIVRHMYQGVVMASAVNWAADDSLRALFLVDEDDVEEQD